MRRLFRVGADQRLEVQILQIDPHVFANEGVTVIGEVVDDLLTDWQQSFDADKRWLETVYVETLQRVRLVELDVNRHEIDTLDAF